MLKAKPKCRVKTIVAPILGVVLLSWGQAEAAIKLGKTVSGTDVWDMPSMVTFHIFAARDAQEPIASQSFQKGEWSSSGELGEGQSLRISAEVTVLDVDSTDSSLWFDTELDGVPVGSREAVVRVVPAGSISAEGGFVLPDDGYVVRGQADLDTGSGVSWTQVSDKPAGFADDVDDVGDAWGELTGMPAGFADGVDDIGDAWDEITGMPEGFADGVDNQGITTEVDPQVGDNAANKVPRWVTPLLSKTGALVEGTIYDDGISIGIGTTSLTGLLNLGPRSKETGIGGTDCSLAGGGYIVSGSTTGANICIDENEIMARSGGSKSTLFLNHDDGGEVQVASNIRMLGSEWGTDGAAIYLYNKAGEITIELDAEEGDGQPGVVVTPRIRITGGADFSEQFSIDRKQYEIKPGMVVSIDPASPGKLQISTEPYDLKVAGIISGAGGVETGMMMGQKGTLADGEHPVALTGRVYTWVDASRDAVEPGDMLTSSSTPGYAMKVTEHGKSAGAVIGKAMTPLAKGKTGLVLVLVSLQ